MDVGQDGLYIGQPVVANNAVAHQAQKVDKDIDLAAVGNLTAIETFPETVQDGHIKYADQDTAERAVAVALIRVMSNAVQKRHEYENAEKREFKIKIGFFHYIKCPPGTWMLSVFSRSAGSVLRTGMLLSAVMIATIIQQTL